MMPMIHSAKDRWTRSEQAVRDWMSFTRLIVATLIAFTFAFLCLQPPSVAKEEIAEAKQLPEPNDPIKRWLHLEKAFVRRVVDLTASQALALDSISIEQVKKAGIPNTLIAPRNIERIIIHVNGEEAPEVDSELENALRTRQIVRRLENSIMNVLAAEQKPVYLKEKEAREKFRRDSSALGLTLFLDQKISLSIQQIRDLQFSLASWAGIKDVNLEAFESTTSMIPIIRESILAEHLTRPQLDLLANYRRISIAEDSVEAIPLFNSILIAR